METLIGGLVVHIVGPPRYAAQLKIHDHKNGTYRVGYKPNGPGIYTLSIKIADMHIPGSPFKIKVVENKDKVFPEKFETQIRRASISRSMSIND